MAHTNFVSFVRITPYQPLIWTNTTKNMLSGFSPQTKKRCLQSFQNMYFKTCSYIQKTTLKLIKTFEVTIYGTKHTKNTQTYFQPSIFLKIHKFGAPWASPDSVWTRSWSARIKNTPDATTLRLHALNLLKRSKKQNWGKKFILIFGVVLYMLRATQPNWFVWGNEFTFLPYRFVHSHFYLPRDASAT